MLYTNAMFFLPNILCVHVRKLGTSVRKSTAKSDLQNLQNQYQCRSEQTSCSCLSFREETYEREVTLFFLSRRKPRPCACVFRSPLRNLIDDKLLGIHVSAVSPCNLVFMLNFLKESHGP